MILYPSQQDFLCGKFFPQTELFKAEQQNAVVERRIKVKEKIKGNVFFLFFNKTDTNLYNAYTVFKDMFLKALRIK